MRWENSHSDRVEGNWLVLSRSGTPPKNTSRSVTETVAAAARPFFIVHWTPFWHGPTWLPVLVYWNTCCFIVWGVKDSSETMSSYVHPSWRRTSLRILLCPQMHCRRNGRCFGCSGMFATTTTQSGSSFLDKNLDRIDQGWRRIDLEMQSET